MKSRRRVALGLAIAALAARGARAEEPDWRGAWQVEDQAAWRHVGREGRALVLEGRVGDLEVALRGAPVAGGFVLVGEATRVVDGAREERHARLAARQARAALEVTLEVTLEVEGQATRRERWARPAAPTLHLEPGGAPRLDPTAPLTLPPDGAPLRVDVRVGGRPLPAARLVVLATDDDPRYAHLGGVVHHVDLGSLPVGRHTLTWSGADRSLDGAALLPGRYLVVVAGADDVVGPPPGSGDAALAATLTLIVGAPEITAAAPDAPALATPALPPPPVPMPASPVAGLTSRPAIGGR